MQGVEGERFGPASPPPPPFPLVLNNVTMYTHLTVSFNFLHATGTIQCSATSTEQNKGNVLDLCYMGPATFSVKNEFYS